MENLEKIVEELGLFWAGDQTQEVICYSCQGILKLWGVNAVKWDRHHRWMEVRLILIKYQRNPMLFI